MNQGVMPRFACINLSNRNKSRVYEYKDDTNLFLVDIVSNMGLVLFLRTIGPPTRHEFDIFNTPCLPFEFEVAVDGEEESV